LDDIKCVVINTHAIEPQVLVEFFKSPSRELTFDYIKGLLVVNMVRNLHIIVQVVKEYID
jgi:hypothetical protein